MAEQNKGDLGFSPYMLPNTVDEAKRLDLQHYILSTFLRSNIVAPVGQPQLSPDGTTNTGSWGSFNLGQILRSTAPRILQPRRILDVGCGTCRWPIEIARQFPLSEVIGIDLVTSARPYYHDAPVPANFRFIQGNILNGLPFADESFDYVHMRLLGLGIPDYKWQDTINELSRVTVSGGWIESIENVPPINGGPALTRINEALEKMLAARSIDLSCLRTVDTYMQQALPDLASIQSRLIEQPVGAHGGGMGLRMAWNVQFIAQNMSIFYRQSGLFGQEEWAALLHDIDLELHDDTYQPMLPFYLAIAQRM